MLPKYFYHPRREWEARLPSGHQVKVLTFYSPVQAKSRCKSPNLLLAAGFQRMTFSRASLLHFATRVLTPIYILDTNTSWFSFDHIVASDFCTTAGFSSSPVHFRA